ncbi:MAG: stage III sporulation protein AE, partial [Lachnospiraceae bacterium]|nr:stage III sporulation protein AE [Lachnospiraceae bacterium]
TIGETVSVAQTEFTVTARSEELPEQVDKELWDKLGLDAADEMVEELLPDGKMSFSDMIISMMKGETKSLRDGIKTYLRETVIYEITHSRRNLIQLLFLAAVGAIFTQLAAGFGNTSVSDTGFYITYLMMFGLLMNSFTVAYQLAGELIHSLIRLMQAALPVFFVATAFSGKVTTSLVFSELGTIVVTIVENLNQSLLLPGVKMFLLLVLSDNLMPKTMFGRFSELLKTGIEWGSKTAFGVVIGLNVIKGMCVPLKDALSSGTVTKLLSALPGIGNAVDSAAGLILGSVRLVKNGIGAATMICLILICLIPLLKLLIVTLLHYAVAAVLEPIADSRLSAAVAGAAQAMQLLLKLALMACVLFFLTIALICSVTG